MDQFVLNPYSVFQSQSTLYKKNETWNKKQEKDENLPEGFESICSAVNARLKTRINKHLIDLVLSSPRNKLIQSKNIIFDNRDTKESIVDFVCALKQKKYRFFRYLLFHFRSNSNSI